jgi:hypothetical protein
MTAASETARARRYLLGDVNSDESAALEQELFERPEIVDRIAAAEDDLIEDYLAGQLSAADRDRFERSYLSAEEHRVRVETIRRLIARATPASRRRLTGYTPWLALAASVLIVGSVVLWEFSPLGRSRDASRGVTQPSVPAVAREENARPSAPTPRVFAVTISPVAVRGASDAPTVAIPPGTDLVDISLESDGEPRRFAPTRVVVRLVSGREVWQGPVAQAGDAARGLAARVNVPGASLPGEDYVLTLYGADPAGREAELAQYFLRVRHP